MKASIHPDYTEIKVACSCGNISRPSTVGHDLQVEVCSNCHPFYTGKQKILDTAGRVDKFRKKYRGIPQAHRAERACVAAKRGCDSMRAPNEITLGVT